MQNQFNNEVTIRRPRALRCLLIGAAVFAIAGCASTPPPTVPEIDKQHEDANKDIQDAKEKMLKNCESLIVPAAPPTAYEECVAKAIAWANEAIAKAHVAKQAAIERRWDDAYKAREEYDKFIRKSLEDLNLPGILKDVIKKQFGSAAKITADWHGQLAACAPVGAECYQTFTLTGPTEITVSGVSDTSVMKIVIDAKGNFGATAVNARPFSGTLTLTSNSGGAVTAVLVDNPGNQLTFDSNGNGILVGLFDISYSAVGWNGVLPRHTFMGIRLTRDVAGGIHCVALEASTSTVFISTPRSVTDYNGDGVRDLMSDYAAFLSGLAQHHSRADVNGDGAWDSLDDADWQAMFEEDTN